jgi:hypothetical protein
MAHHSSMFQELVLDRASKQNSEIGCLPLEGIARFISISSYVLRTLRPGIYRLLEQQPQLLSFLRALIAGSITVKYALGPGSALFKYLLTFIACSISLSNWRTPYHNLQHLLTTTKTYKFRSSTAARRVFTCGATTETLASIAEMT